MPRGLQSTGCSWGKEERERCKGKEKGQRKEDESHKDICAKTLKGMAYKNHGAVSNMLVVHSGEIVLKGKNRGRFERQMRRNLARLLGTRRVESAGGKYIVRVDPTPEQVEILRVFPGVSKFYVAKEVEADVDALAEAAARIVRGARTFKIEARRSDKSFPLTSLEINREVGRRVVEKTGLYVDLKNPDVTVYIDVLGKTALVTNRIERGPGGLPVGVSAPVVALISGGIDSPVAAWMMMKRGCPVTLVHFLNATTVMHMTENKIVRLARRLFRIQLEGTLHVVPFARVQSLIIKHVDPRYRTLVYRRSMLRMAEIIAQNVGAKALVTGDSVGQVASQTVENLHAVYAAVELPVLPPLIGMNKEETVEIAQRIGTYEISKEPYDDCCVLLIGKHPETRATPERLEREEEKIPNIREVEAAAVDAAKILRF